MEENDISVTAEHADFEKKLPYDTKAIRKLLTAVFDDEDLKIFCYDRFRPVFDKFAAEMSRLWKIQILIDYCEKHNQFDKLLSQVKDINSGQYDKFISSIKPSFQKTLKPTINSDRSQVEITLKGDLSHLTPELQSAAIGAIAGVLNISRDQVTFLQVQKGSIILQLELPTEAVNELIILYETNDPIMKDLGVENVKVIQEQTPQSTAPKAGTSHIKLEEDKARHFKPEWKDELAENIKKRSLWILSILIDLIFMILWLIGAFSFNNLVNTLFLLHETGTDRLLVSILQWTFAIALLIPIIAITFKDIAIIIFRVRKELQTEVKNDNQVKSLSQV
ncbi:MAG: hypothetical protein KDJ52_04120 [Anaerolineae bacterium]|nr:hypothetical protein [Anaerolineae bacterium]